MKSNGHFHNVDKINKVYNVFHDKKQSKNNPVCMKIILASFANCECISFKSSKQINKIKNLNKVQSKPWIS